MKHSISMLLFLLLLSVAVHSQTNNCTTAIDTEVKGEIIRIKSTQSYLTFNSKSGELKLTFDLKSLDGEFDTLDAFFDTRDDQFIFSGKLNGNLFDQLNLQKNSDSNFPITGLLTLNQITDDVNGNYGIFKFSNERDEPLRNLRFSLSLHFSPKDFGIQKILPQLTNEISIQINEAIVTVIE
ncbi:MAG: hypothetical protein V4651_09460 [Bacteroidota bacterium]